MQTKGLYINLKKRTDRKKHFEERVKSRSFFSNVERMDAIEYSNGAIGCGFSHLKCLFELGNLSKGGDCIGNFEDKYVVVMEDDFFILNEINFQYFSSSFEKIKNSNEWDIIVLTPRGDTVINENKNEMNLNGFSRIINNQTTTGYIIKTEFIPYLYKNIKTAVEQLIQTKDLSIYSIDQYWKRLQSEHKFYYYNHIFAGQLPGWSDLEKRIVNYNERFIQQV
jgi:GR25 family glycosyltransferase involved in LPS biosynthesis